MTVSLSLLAPVLLFSMAESGAQTASPVFHSTSQMVLVPVSVTDRNARNVEGAARGRLHDFRQSDVSGRSFLFGVDDAPCSIVVVLDISGSMQKALVAAKDMLEAFFGTAESAG